ncbi:AAA family ATPase [Streptomyces sp. NPDC057927]
MTEIIKVTAVVTKELYCVEGIPFKCYSFKLKESDQPLNIDPEWGTFVVTGNAPTLIKGKEYKFTVKPSKSKKYGDGYSFVEFPTEKLDSIGKQQEYLKQLITNKQYETIINAYPNVMILDYIVEGKLDVSKLKGIGEKNINGMKDKLNKYMVVAHALIELSDLGITPTSLESLVKHFGTQENLIQKVKSNIYSLTEVTYFGFKRVDEYALDRGDNPESVNRIKACFRYIIEQEGKRGHTWISIEDITKQSLDLLNINLKVITDVLIELIKNENKVFFVIGEKVSLKKYYGYEKVIKQELDRIMNTYEQSHDIKIQDIEKELRITYTEEQRNAITLANEKGVILLNGKAGTGKTAVVTGIIKSLRNESYIACALSGQAVNVLKTRGVESSTIHRLLMSVDRKKGEQLDYDVVIVDESSMVNSDLFAQLLSIIKDGTRVILVGDDGQLPPIGLGAVFSDLLNHSDYPKQELNIVHRQAQQSGILSYANKVRNGEQINGYVNYTPQVLGDLQDFTLVPRRKEDRESLVELVVGNCVKSFAKHGQQWLRNMQVIVANKEKGNLSEYNLNIKLQQVFNPGQSKSIKSGKYSYKEGDKIIHNGNNPEAKLYVDYFEFELAPTTFKSIRLYNGSVGYIEKIDTSKKLVFLNFNDVEGLICYSVEEMMKVSLAYAITIHKSQGLGIPTVLMTFDFGAFTLLSKQLIYTGMTRASKQLVMICENGALHRAIKTDLSSSRRTFLPLFLGVE